VPNAVVRRASTFIAAFALVAAAVAVAAPARAAADGPVATPVSPVNGAVLDRGDFDFRWTSPAGAVSYEVRAGLDGRTDVATGALVEAPSTATISTAGPVLTVADLPNGTYYWQVRALGSEGSPGPWSAVRTVEVAVPGDVGFQLETLGLDEYSVPTPLGSTPSNSVVSDRLGALAVVLAGGFSALLLAVVARAWLRARRAA